MPVYLESLLLIVPVVLEACTGGVMLWRKLHREFPSFFLFMVFQIASSIVGCWILYFRKMGQATYATYYYTYFGAELITAVLVFLVIRNIFDHVFRPYRRLHGWSSGLFLLGSAFLVLISVVTVVMAPGSEMDRLFAGILLLERSATLIQAGLLFFLFAAAVYMGLSLRRHVFGIALGLGLAVSVDVAAWSIRILWGPGGGGWSSISWIRTVAYNLAVIVWFSCILSRQRAPEKLLQPLPTPQLEQWNQSIAELLSQ